MSKQKSIVLVGLPGSGKSTLGQLLAQQLGLPFIDLDAVIETEAGSSIAQLFAQKGEPYFRELESALLKKVLQGPVPVVLATGGGAPCFYDNMAYIRMHTRSVYLNVPWPLLAQRLAKQPGKRPLLQGLTAADFTDALKEKFGWRIPYYQQAQLHLQIAEEQSVEYLVEQLLQKLPQ